MERKVGKALDEVRSFPSLIWNVRFEPICVRPLFRWRGSALGEGKHTIVFDFKYDGPGVGKGGTGVLSVDGKEVDRKLMEHTIPFLLPADESFDVGLDTRTPVDFTYDCPFRFTGSIDKLTFNLGKSQLSAEDHKKMDDAIARVNN